MFTTTPFKVLPEAVTFIYPPSNTQLVLRKQMVNSKKNLKKKYFLEGIAFIWRLTRAFQTLATVRLSVRRVFVHNRILSPMFVFVHRMCEPPGAVDVLFPVRSKHTQIYTQSCGRAGQMMSE